MSENRVEVIDYGEFDAREWLRRDVLWASLMSPYSKQMEGWIDGTQKAQHDGNVSRQNLYAQGEDAEAQSMAFFNQGKNVAGLISSVALFKACIAGKREGASVNSLAVQARAIDIALHGRPDANVMSEADTYVRCSELAKEASIEHTFGNTQRLLRASRLMLIPTINEVHSWVEMSRQDDESTLPNLTIHDGGHPRSAGPRVEMLQPIFRQILGSEDYLALTV